MQIFLRYPDTSVLFVVDFIARVTIILLFLDLFLFILRLFFVYVFCRVIFGGCFDLFAEFLLRPLLFGDLSLACALCLPVLFDFLPAIIFLHDFWLHLFLFFVARVVDFFILGLVLGAEEIGSKLRKWLWCSPDILVLATEFCKLNSHRDDHLVDLR